MAYPEDKYDALLILAQYDKHGNLVGLTSSASGEVADGKLYSGIQEISEDGNILRIYRWSCGNLSAYSDYIEIPN